MQRGIWYCTGVVNAINLGRIGFLTPLRFVRNDKEINLPDHSGQVHRQHRKIHPRAAQQHKHVPDAMKTYQPGQ